MAKYVEFSGINSRLCRIVKRSHIVQVKTGRVHKIFHLSILIRETVKEKSLKIKDFFSQLLWFNKSGLFSTLYGWGYSHAEVLLRDFGS